MIATQTPHEVARVARFAEAPAGYAHPSRLAAIALSVLPAWPHPHAFSEPGSRSCSLAGCLDWRRVARLAAVIDVMTGDVLGGTALTDEEAALALGSAALLLPAAIDTPRLVQPILQYRGYRAIACYDESFEPARSARLLLLIPADVPCGAAGTSPADIVARRRDVALVKRVWCWGERLCLW